MEEVETTEDLEQVGEVKLKINELHSFVGSIILHGDSRDYPSISGEVEHVTKGEICLAPAIIEGQRVQETKIAIQDTARCAITPENWEQNLTSPLPYQAEQIIQQAVDNWANDTNQQSTHKRSK